MQEDEVALLVDRAGHHEREYDWQRATELYRKALAEVLNTEDVWKAAELQDKIGFSLLRTAFQAQINSDFRVLIKESAEAYESAVKLFEKTSRDERKERVKESRAMVAFVRSWLFSDFDKMYGLLEEWWNLKREVLKVYEKNGNLLAAGKIYNDLLEYSFENRFHLFSDWCDIIRESEEYLRLGEKAIKVLSEVDDEYELARAFCWTGWYYCFSAAFRVSEERVTELKQKAAEYSKKALELSERTGDAWLIGWSNHVRGFSEHINGRAGAEYNAASRKAAATTRNNHLLAESTMIASRILCTGSRLREDPAKRREMLQKSLEFVKEALGYYRVIQNSSTIIQVYAAYVDTLVELASLETEIVIRKELLTRAVDLGKEFLQENMYEITLAVHSLSVAEYLLSKITAGSKERKNLLEEALDFRLQYVSYLEGTCPLRYGMQSASQYFLALIRVELANNETAKNKKVAFLNMAVSAMESCVDFAEKDMVDGMGLRGRYGAYYYGFGEVLIQLYALTKERSLLTKALEVYRKAAELFNEAELVTRAAEACWQTAQTFDRLGMHLQAAENYRQAAETYKKAAHKIPQLFQFYRNYSIYMEAWSEIEHARYSHIEENYEEASNHYKESARLHGFSKPWSYLRVNYNAWAKIEKAEDLSRKEKAHEAMEVFREASELFSKTEEVVKARSNEIIDPDEKRMVSKLILSATLRHSYCQVRINMEVAKGLDREGKYSQSSKIYKTAAQNLKQMMTLTEAEEEKAELRLMLILCQAWERLSQAEEHSSPEIYLEAAEFFEQAKIHSNSKRTTQLAMGNSSFCRGLAAGTRFQTTLTSSQHSIAKRYMEKAATYYFQAGYGSASEYAKATLRLFDAYIYMNNAETELDPEKKTKNYAMAERLLQMAAGSFVRANQPEKRAQVQTMLERVKEERSLAIALSEVLHAPAITSSSASFITPGSTSEESVGLQRFEHADIQAKVFLNMNEVKVGENVTLEIELLNTGKEVALVTEIENVVPKGFSVVEKPEIYRLENSHLDMKGKMISPLKVESAKLVLRSMNKGLFELKIKIVYLDELGNSRFCKPEPLALRVKEVVKPDRIATGTKELDALLFGGLPKNYAIALTAPPNDERELIVKNFLKIGIQSEQSTLYITTEPTNLSSLLRDPPSNLYLFVCNPNPKTNLPNHPNIHWLRSKTDVNNLNIALAKTYRITDQIENMKRIAIENISDILLHYGVETTRRWLSDLIREVTTKGFTLIALINPLMHQPEQLHAILDIFDGEISLYETEDRYECKRFIRVKNLRNQDYLKNPICLI